MPGICSEKNPPGDKYVQLARTAHREETTPHQTLPMSEAEVDAWRAHWNRQVNAARA